MEERRRGGTGGKEGPHVGWMGAGLGGALRLYFISVIGTAFRHFDLLAPFSDPLCPLSFLFFTSSSSLLSFLPSSLPFSPHAEFRGALHSISPRYVLDRRNSFAFSLSSCASVVTYSANVACIALYFLRREGVAFHPKPSFTSSP